MIVKGTKPTLTPLWETRQNQGGSNAMADHYGVAIAMTILTQTCVKRRKSVFRIRKPGNATGVLARRLTAEVWLIIFLTFAHY